MTSPHRGFVSDGEGASERRKNPPAPREVSTRCELAPSSPEARRGSRVRERSQRRGRRGVGLAGTRGMRRNPPLLVAREAGADRTLAGRAVGW